MELKEYYKIIRQSLRFFMVVVLLVMVGVSAFFLLRPISYTTSITVNITRNGSQNTPDYKYDDFYRLQADERFADTVVQWLKSPRIVSDIYSDAGLNYRHLTLRQLSRSFKAEKLSSQVISVTFGTPDSETGKKLSASIVSVISKNTANLNKDQSETGWFEIVAGDPVILLDTFDMKTVLFLSLIAGIFLAFWAVLIRHYLK